MTACVVIQDISEIITSHQLMVINAYGNESSAYGYQSLAYGHESSANGHESAAYGH